MFYIPRKWSINTVKEFDGLNSKNIRFILYKQEKERVYEMDITELRDLKKFFDNWVDPFQIGNPEHIDKMKNHDGLGDILLTNKEGEQTGYHPK